MSSSLEPLDLGDILRPLLRWWWLLIVSTLLAAGFSAYSVINQPPTYRSYTTLMVGTVLADPNPNSGEINTAMQLAATYADIARRSTIAGAAQEALGLPWLPEYAVRQVPQTQIIEITVTALDPQLAQAVAAELVRQLMRQTPGNGLQADRQAFVDQQLDEMEQSIVATTEEIARLKRELEDLYSARQIADTNAQIAALESKLTAIQANYSALLAGSQRGASNTLTVLEPANLPTTPVDSKPEITVLVAALLGFVVAAAGAYLLEYLDDTFKGEDEVNERLGLATLAAIPVVPGYRRHAGILDAAEGSHSAAAHAFGGLRIALEAAALGAPARVLLVTSPSMKDGKSFVAANLAVEIAQTGQRVVLVDADLRRPSQQRIFRLPNYQGLTTWFQHATVDFTSILQATSIPDLTLLTSGPLPASPAQVLSSVRMQDLLHQLQSWADVIILDTPPLTAAVDASILATKADGVLLVLTMNRTRRSIAERSVKMLRQIHADLLGVVLDHVPVHSTRYTHSYHYGGYGASEWTSAKAQTVSDFDLDGVQVEPAEFRLRPTASEDKGTTTGDIPT